MKIDLNSLDDLNTAVMMCSPDGTVIYKNKMAMKEIRLPKRNTHVQPHLSPLELRKFNSIEKQEKACLVALDTGDYKMRAFVSNYVRRGEPCTLWVFVPYVQTAAASKYIYVLEDDVVTLADDICEIIKCIDEKDSIAGNKGKGALDRKIRNKVDKIIAYLFFGANDTRYAINKSMNMLINATEQTFSKFGYNIKYNFTANREHCLLFIDMKSFSIFYFHMLTFFADCGVDKNLTADFAVTGEEMNDMKMKIKLTFTMPYPPFYADGESDVMKLAQLSPKNVIDVLIFQRFCDAYKYDIKFSINDDFVDNVAVFIEIPLIFRMIYCDSDQRDEMDRYYLLTDLIIAFGHMLRARVFDPDTVSLN